MLIGRRLRALSRTSQDRVADVGATVAEVLGAMKIVQAFGQEQREAGRFQAAVAASFAVARRRILMRAFMTAIVITISFGSITTIMWQGALDVAAARLAGGAIAAFDVHGGSVAGGFSAPAATYGVLPHPAGVA